MKGHYNMDMTDILEVVEERVFDLQILMYHDSLAGCEPMDSEAVLEAQLSDLCEAIQASIDKQAGGPVPADTKVCPGFERDCWIGIPAEYSFCRSCERLANEAWDHRQAEAIQAWWSDAAGQGDA